MDYFYNIINILVINDTLDVKTALNIAKSCKDGYKHIMSYKRLFTISNEDYELKLISKYLNKERIHITDVNLFITECNKGCVDIVKKLLNEETTIVDDSSKTKSFIKLCLNFNVQSVILTQVDLIIMEIFRNFIRRFTSVIDGTEIKYKIYTQYIEIISYILEWYITNQCFIKAKIKSTDINSLSLLKITIQKNKHIMKEGSRCDIDINIKQKYESLLKYNIKLCKAWIMTYSQEVDTFIGNNKGLYYIDFYGNKKYIKS